MTLTPPGQAWDLLLPYLAPLAVEAVPRREALHRCLAADLAATTDLPATDVSAMDGYALSGPRGAGDRLLVTGTIAAGDAPGIRLERGAAVRIMTGAPVPPEADRVIPVEQTRLPEGAAGSEVVELLDSPREGAHIRRRGEVLRDGAMLLRRGTVLTPGSLSLVAAHGHETVEVFRRPRVAVVATGDEVVPPHVRPAPGQLRDTHTDFLLAAGHAAGLSFDSLGIAPDDVDALRERVATGMERDVLLLTGGVSMGEFDFVEGVLRELGCRILFEKVAVQPAKPVVAAVHDGGLVFGLPGNPASAMVAFWLFVRPALRRLQGLDDGYWRGALEGVLEGGLPPAKGRDRFLPAHVRFAEGRIFVTPVVPRGSHDVGSYGLGTALVRVPAHSPPRSAGDGCDILPLGEWLTAGAPGPKS